MLSARKILIFIIFSLNTCVILEAHQKSPELASLRESILDKKRELQQQIEQQKKLIFQLNKQEKDLFEATQKRRETQQSINKLNREIKTLNDAIEALNKKKKQQEMALMQQFDAAFRLGKNNEWHWFLNNQETLRRSRMFMYFDYLNQAREKNLEDLDVIYQELTLKKTTLSEKQQQQQKLLESQKTQQSHLQKFTIERRKTLSALELSLTKNKADLTEMRKNERRLQEEIIQAEKEAKARAQREERETRQIYERQKQAKAKGSIYKPTPEERALMSRSGGIGAPKSKLLWPVSGIIEHHFGEMLQGELRWKGMVIRAPEGTKVNAIASGRVLMANWLQGYGLVIVIEHGKGDLSLYGYNQNALVNVGENVKTGQPIAQVGASGGEGIPSLYFEIRRQGKAVDPRPWLAK